MTSTAASPDAQTRLMSVQQDVAAWLKALAQSPNLENILSLSFGADLDWGRAEQRMAEWRAGNFGALPKFELVPDGDLGGSAGAYSTELNTILLAQDWALDPARPTAEVARVILEEVGHALDADLNRTDTSGDEGAIFATLVMGGGLDESQIAALRAENDWGLVTRGRF